MAANKTSRNEFPVNMSGLRFGRLLVVERSERVSKDRAVSWVCRCDCGEEFVTLGRSLRRGLTVSCGCFGKEQRRKANTTHAKSKTGAYKVWTTMVARCTNPNASAYPYYGGRGITVCDRWKESFEAFAEDMGDRPEGQTVERVDNDGPYSPENCRWATRKEQSSNTRRSHWVTFEGETRILSEWAEILGIGSNALEWRMENWGLERALTTYGPRTKATSGSLSSSFSLSSPSSE